VFIHLIPLVAAKDCAQGHDGRRKEAIESDEGRRRILRFCPSHSRFLYVQFINLPIFLLSCESNFEVMQITSLGVMSAQVDGERITVVGDGVDAVALTVMLRKKMCYAELVSVGPAEEKKEEKKDEKKEEKKAEGGDKSSSAQQVIWPCQFPVVPQQIIYETPYNDPCCILWR